MQLLKTDIIITTIIYQQEHRFSLPFFKCQFCSSHPLTTQLQNFDITVGDSGS